VKLLMNTAENDKIDDEIYEPMTKGLIWLLRCAGGAAVMALSVFVGWFHARDALQGLVLALFALVIFEVYVQVRVGWRRQLVRSGTRVIATVVKKYETTRGPTSRITARYTVNGQVFEKTGTVSGRTYYRLEIGQLFPILVSPKYPTAWIADPMNPETHPPATES
jgi:hypothetical protein